MRRNYYSVRVAFYCDLCGRHVGDHFGEPSQGEIRRQPDRVDEAEREIGLTRLQIASGAQLDVCVQCYESLPEPDAPPPHNLNEATVDDADPEVPL